MPQPLSMRHHKRALHPCLLVIDRHRKSTSQLLRVCVALGILEALLRLLQDRLGLRLRVVASHGLLLGQQFCTRGNVPSLGLVVMTIG